MLPKIPFLGIDEDRGAVERAAVAFDDTDHEEDVESVADAFDARELRGR